MLEIKGEEFKLEACIQFTLLQKILIKLSERDQEQQDKIDELEKKLKNFENLQKKINEINGKKFETIESNILKLAEGNTNIEKTTIINVIKNKDDNDNDNDNKDDNDNDNKDDKLENKKEKQLNEKEIDYIEKEEQENEKEEKDEKSKSEINDSEDKKEEKENKTNKKEENESNNNINENEELENEEEIKISSQQNIIGINNLNSDNNNNNNENNQMRSNNTNNTNNNNTNNSNSELFSLLNKRIHQCEKKIEELQKSSKIHNTLSNEININKNGIIDANKEIENLKKIISDLEAKLKQAKEELNSMKVKVEDFNIYDMFKDNGEGNLDTCKLLVMNLEKKVFTKFDQVDSREKAIEGDLFKNKNDITNCLNSNDLLKRENENMKKLFEDLLKDFNEHKEDSTNKFNDINNKIDDLYSKLSNAPNKSENNNNIGFDENKVKELINNSLNDLENKLMDNVNKIIEKLKSQLLDLKNNLSLREQDLQLITNLQNNLSELEGELKNKPNKDLTDNIYERLLKLEEEIKKKATKYDLEEFNERLYQLEERSKNHSNIIDTLNEAVDKLRSEMSLVVRKIEFLTGEYSKLAFNQGDSSNKNAVAFDFSKIVDIQKFNETIKAIYQKLEHLKYNVETHQRNIDDIFERLKHTPTEEDFIQFQNLLKAMIEDLKVYCNKRYGDKIDIQKNFRYIETQIKSILENNKNRNEGETWLLAKKPMNGYLCASCESYIKDLNTKNEYVPWNRYPQRDDKQYRMGHGFSRMLQMVNADLLKSQEMREQYKSGNLSDDEKNEGRIQSGKNREIKLPLVSNQRGHSAFNKSNNDNNINKNSNRNIANYNEANSNNNKGSFRMDPIKIDQSLKHIEINYSGNDINDPFKDGLQSENQPKITRIIKKNKGINSSTSLDNSDSKINNSDYIPSLTEPNQ